MLYGQSQPVQVSESKQSWKPINQQSYMAKLNSFAADQAAQYSMDNSFSASIAHQQSCGSQMNSHTKQKVDDGQMNTWSVLKKQHLNQGLSQLHTQFQNISDSPAHPNSYFKKMRNLSNEDNKMQRHVSSKQGHFSEFGQNQISVQNQSSCLINLDMEQTIDGKQAQNISTVSSIASTNENSNSDVEIIEDDYGKNGLPIPGLYHAKSQLTYKNQTTSDFSPHHHVQHNMGMSKVHSTFSTIQHQNYDHFDDVSSFTGEATRATQKKKFVNREERFEFNQKIEKMKKTEMCRNIIMYHHCKYGDACSYAHNMDELVPKQHLPSNYKTKMCSQYHDDGYCMYGQRCQFLHSIYDLSDKTNLSYQRGLKEEARLTWQRIQQGSDCIMVNILKGRGCVAPESRLPCFVSIYNKDDYKAELLKKDQEKQMKGFQNNYGTYDRQSQSNQYNINKPNSINTFQQQQQSYTYQQRKCDTWNNNRFFASNNWQQRQQQYADNNGYYSKPNYRRINSYKFQDTKCY